MPTLFANRRGFIALQFNVFQTGQTQDFEVELRTRSGKAKFFAITARVIKGEGGEAIGISGMMRDVTQRRIMEGKLREYALNLHVRNIELDAFTKTVAHDLKSPLMPVVANADLLMTLYGEQLGDKGCKILERIITTGVQLGRIVDEMLLLASLRHPPQIVPLVMGQVVSNSLERVRQTVGEMPAFSQPETWFPALGYAPWVEAVWVNYISNAIKYGGTPPYFQLGATKLDNGHIRYWVKDNGKGIPKAQQARLFAPFERLDQQKIKGTGVGLSNVKQIIEKLNGDVGMFNHTNGGSLFWFSLPAFEQN